ncbi:phosphatidylinositol 4-phosphate 3-kinase C2 domain-containing subunit alpha isoform X2 [Eurytemora carolleeae]|uniref:phosphatidylinositol 4-phosphate 3-kinase C2 domain-containing subunit alpha isoform X2 n=1 Tax=Eurytemora carolleeae TaxID=1294199 RepID=UPI000C758977|nr:phosphatidylinositol 4-phosphate 3-kinase C2 domain-containing subunit alpha isoform X2 [Eurytemora carolleeae]|eukprot:XP_023349683.1 phosphatidylinositol 4-phosphate 3-kinase C2 domain-containing subunit alpha-like isoform X2 [Eurytemora affinis]
MFRFLISRCLSSPMLTHSLYWHLTQCLPGVSPQNSDGGSDKDKFGISAARHQRRLQLLLRTLFVISGQALRNKLFAQQVLVQELYQSAEAVKTSKDNNRHNILARHMENLHHQLRTTPTLVPLSASMTASGVDVKSCQHFNSNTFPLKVVLNSAENDGGVIQIIYKVGDDLRQDMLTLQMIRVMDRLWLKGSLDLRIVYFSCVPTGYKSGIVEFVEHANTLREIQVAETGVTGTFRSETLNEWLQKHNPSQLEFKRAVSNFTRSCAGYSVVTYVLGICDRHNDNIMLKTSGHLFHIDFGKFLGDAQKFGAIKRDRVPFVLTPDMLYVINGGKGSTEKFHTFVELSCQAFNILRREGNLILTLFALMASSGIPGVTKEAVSYVHDRLLLDLSEEEAAARFGQLIHESINSSLSTQLNFFVHNLAQLKFGKSGGSEDNVALSFIPNKYSLKSDGKIKEVVVHGIQKRYDTEKHYVFILKISRQGIKDPAYIFRTYKQFCEFHSRLCTLYPLTKFPSITNGYSIGRSNIREVAEKRKREIGTFLSNLFVLAEEISHSDLVYTFFHPLLKDEEETSIHIQKLKDPRGHVRKPSVGRIKGRLKLKVYYRNQTLHVLIQFIENLAMNDAREEPNSYVKVYLHPDPTKQTKRKTKVVRRSCNPSFMEMLEYRIPLDRVRCRTLQATVWDSSQFQENMFLGSVTVPLDDIDLTTGLEQWFNLGQFYR